MLGIYPISLDQLRNHAYLEQEVYPCLSKEYYWSEDFSAEFYIAQAKAGFMAICETIDNQQLLLPEIQRSYAALLMQDIHISKKVSKIIRRDNPKVQITTELEAVAKKIALHHKDNWLSSAYLKTLSSTKGLDAGFRAISSFVTSDDKMIAGEIGYIIGRTYTSLSGFSSKEKKYRDYGKTQMVLLAKELHSRGVHFWNLGHPYMPYKTAIGATIYRRDEFLELWHGYSQ